MMTKFLESVIRISAYALLFCLFIGIAGWKLETREIIAISFAIGFFADLIERIEIAVRELIDKK